MIEIARAADSPSADATFTRPSSSTSIFTPVRSMMLRIILPPGPMTSRILSTGIRIVTMRGAKSEMFSRDDDSASCILPRMCIRPWRACSSAFFITAVVMPPTLMSICSAVMPDEVPATLKSMSP